MGWRSLSPTTTTTTAKMKYDKLPTDVLEIPHEDSEPSTTSSFEDSERGLLGEEPVKPRWNSRHRQSLLRRSLRRTKRVCRPIYILGVVVFLVTVQLLFNESYPERNARKFEVPKEEKVYVAANIIDGELIKGAWGDSLVKFVEELGKERVFVSIYGGPKGALKELEGRLEGVEKAIISEEEQPLDLTTIPRTLLPNGEHRIKRIAYLAEIRNKALEPLKKLNKEGTRFSKILFINDVYWEPKGAFRLLWGTREEYKAVCAADFVTSWKYYDTFATRDSEGYSIGVPLYPWFATAGNEGSRNDVLAGREDVRVKSCWGGMVAFDASYFQIPEVQPIGRKEKRDEGDSMVPSLPVRFRSEREPFWDSSECCLIHADIIAISPPTPPPSQPIPYSPSVDTTEDTGIYMNPYVRTAYSAGTFKWLSFARRWERLFSPIQRIANRISNMPRFNVRRHEIGGETIKEMVWVPFNTSSTSTRDSNQKEQMNIFQLSDDDEDDLEEIEFGSEDSTWQASGLFARNLGVQSGVVKRGLVKRATLGEVKNREWWATQGEWVEKERVARRGGYCGVRQLLVIDEERGGGSWDNLLGMVPPV